MYGIEIWQLVVLVFTGLIASIIGAIAGSGGLLITPLLLLVGLSPAQAIATQNFYAIPTFVSASAKFRQKGALRFREILPYIPALLVFSMAGAYTLCHISADTLKLFLPVLLIVLALWVLLTPSLDSYKSRITFSVMQFGMMAVPVLAFYDGFASTCSTTFYTIACVTLLKTGTLRATALSKLLSLGSSVGSLLVYGTMGHVMWAHGLALALGGVVGAQIGAHLAVKHGERLIRVVLVVMTSAVCLKLLASQWL